MKLLKTINRIIQEAEEQYNTANDSNLTLEELDRLEKNYRDSLKLMKLYQKKIDSSHLTDKQIPPSDL